MRQPNRTNNKTTSRSKGATVRVGCGIVVVVLTITLDVESVVITQRCWSAITGDILNLTYGTDKNLHISHFLQLIFDPIYYGPP